MLVRIGIGFALGVLCATTGVRAGDTTETTDSAPTRAVEIVVVGSEPDFDAVRSTLGPNGFDGASVRWTRAPRLETAELLERRPEASDVEVRAWIDLSDPKNAALYFADRAGERFLVRSVALPDGLTPLGREALGQVLELSVRALLEDHQIGMSRAETSELLHARSPEPVKPAPPPDTRPEPAPATAAARQSSLGAEVFYGARLYSNEVAIVHGPGLGLGWITESETARSIVWVTGQYELSQELTAPEVSVDWATVRVQGGFGFEFAVAGSGVFAGGRIGAGADFTRFSPRPGTGGESVALEPSQGSTVPVLSLAFEGSIPLASRLGASARLGASFYPVRVHYDIARGDERQEILAPYSVRPGIELCLHLR
ncbi:MAG TPA: hypothetical protein VF103_15545 [Polyangiaceae bacterium]